MDLDLWDCLGKVKLVVQQNYIALIKLFVVILDSGKTLSYSQIDRVTKYTYCPKLKFSQINNFSLIHVVQHSVINISHGNL